MNKWKIISTTVLVWLLLPITTTVITRLIYGSRVGFALLPEDSYELATTVLAAIIRSIPYVALIIFAIGDLPKKDPSHTMHMWLGGLLCIGLLNFWMNFVVVKAGVLGLRGASTAGISLLAFPFVGIIPLFLGRFLGSAIWKTRLIKNEDTPIK